MTKPTLLAMASLLSAQMETLDQHFNVVRLNKESNPEKVMQEVKDDVEVVLGAMGNPIKAHLMDALPNLKMIALFAVGYDNVDIDEAKRRDIVVTNTPDLVTADTADTALSLLLAVSRRVVEMDAFVRIGRWGNGVKPPLGHSLTTKKVGIVGLGRIGQAIAKRCEAFDMHVSYFGRNEKPELAYRYYDDLIQMAYDVDYLVLSCPGGTETHHMINGGVLAALGEKGYLVNVARGSVVDSNALVDALKEKNIAGAALDVYENEPNVPEALKAMDNVVLLPHIGTATYETRSAMGDLVVKNLLAFFDGKPVLTPVT